LREISNGSPSPPIASPLSRRLSDGQAFVWMDRQLDAIHSGPMYLRQPTIAQLVVDSMQRGVQLADYDLHAYVVMANVEKNLISTQHARVR
jgi:hypothetical protein